MTLDQRLLVEVHEQLGAHVLEKLQRRGIEVRLGAGVSAVTPESVTLSTGEVIPTRTVVWTGGVTVNPVLRGVALPKSRHGALLVNGFLQVVDHPEIFALGDCAAVPLPDGSGFYTPTAQNAIRQGTVAAENLAALIRGSSELKTFHYRAIGSLASLGQRQAIAEIGNIRFSGLPAWLAWRAIYVAKMPTWADRIRVGLDWIKELITPVDTVQIPINRQTFGVAPSLPPADVAPSAPLTTAPPAAVRE
jgi:NADH dehydrogenase